MEFVTLYTLFLFFLLGFVFIYSIGNIIYSLFDTKMGSNTELFLKLVTGLVFLIFVYSIFTSKGKTFNLIPFGVLLGAIIINKREIKFETYFSNLKEIQFKNIVLFIVVGFFYFIIQSRFNFNVFSGEKILIEGDQLYYSTVGNFLNQYGVENRFINIDSVSALKLIPYHYGDSWLIAFFISISKLPAPYVYIYMVNPLFMLIFYVGNLAILEKYKVKRSFILSFLISFIVFFTSISLPIFDFLPGRLYQWSLVNLPKQGINYIGFLLFFILTINDKIKLALFLTPIFFMLYMVSLPIVFVSCFVLIFVFFLHKKIPFNSFFSLISFYICFAFSILIFYILFAEDNSSSANSLSFFQIVKQNPTKYFRVFLNCFVGCNLLALVGLSFYFVFILITKKITLSFIKRNAIVLLPFIVFYFVSLVFYCVFHFHPDGGQFWYNTFYPILGSFFSFFIVLIFKNKNEYFAFFSFLTFICLNLFFNFSLEYNSNLNKNEILYNNHLENSFYSKASNFIKSKDKPRFAYLKTYKSVDYFQKNPYNGLFPNFSLLSNCYFPTCLSVFEMPSSEDEILKSYESNILKNTPFYLFVCNLKKKNKFKSIEASQLLYIREMKIDFLELENGQKLPSNLLNLIDTILINERSNDKLLILNHLN